jgi:hypothetical protein
MRPTVVLGVRVRFDVRDHRVAGSGDNLTLNLPITFISSFAGAKSTWMRADRDGGILFVTQDYP